MNTTTTTPKTPSAAADKTAHTPEGEPTREQLLASALLDAQNKKWDGWNWKEYQKAIVRQNWHISKLEGNAPTMLQALKDLTSQIQLGKLNIRRDFSLMNAHAAATKAIFQAENQQ